MNTSLPSEGHLNDRAGHPAAGTPNAGLEASDRCPLGHGRVRLRPNWNRRVDCDESCQVKWAPRLSGARNGVRLPSANPASVYGLDVVRNALSLGLGV